MGICKERKQNLSRRKIQSVQLISDLRTRDLLPVTCINHDAPQCVISYITRYSNSFSSRHLHLHFTSPWKWWQHGPPKRLYPSTSLHGATTQKATTWIFICPSVNEKMTL